MAYASKYYDPVKRHEYYEKHKKLKGRQSRKSTASLNEEGKIAAKEVKEGLLADRKAEYEAVKEEMQKAIEAIRAEMKELSPKQRKRRKEEFKQRIAELRQEAKEKKAKIKADYDERYLQELDKIKADGSFAKEKKSKKKK